MKHGESSPGVWVDFELRQETQPLLEKVSNKDLEGWLERNSDRVVPIGVLSSFEDWSQGHTEHAVQWVSSLPSGPHFDVFTQTLISKATGRQGLDHPAAAGMAAKISDPSLRLEAQRKLNESWLAEDVFAAAAWEQSQPAAHRERLNESP